MCNGQRDLQNYGRRLLTSENTVENPKGCKRHRRKSPRGKGNAWQGPHEINHQLKKGPQEKSGGTGVLPNRRPFLESLPTFLEGAVKASSASQVQPNPPPAFAQLQTKRQPVPAWRPICSQSGLNKGCTLTSPEILWKSPGNRNMVLEPPNLKETGELSTHSFRVRAEGKKRGKGRLGRTESSALAGSVVTVQACPYRELNNRWEVLHTAAAAKTEGPQKSASKKRKKFESPPKAEN